MIELAGLVFGGVSRLAQHWMDLSDKEKERRHEIAMYEHQLALADRKHEHDAALRRMDVESAASAADMSALMVAIESQAKEARAAGGWVAKLSASVRPVIMYWLLGIYSASKVSAILLAHQGGADLVTAVQHVYGDFDAAMMSSALSYWLADRSLLKRWGRA